MAEVFNYKAAKMNLTFTCIASYMQIRRTLLPWECLCCSYFFISGNFYFSFVSTSLAYITITTNKRKAKITWDKKFTGTSMLGPRGRSLHFKWQGWSNEGKTPNPKYSLLLQTKPTEIPGPNFKPPKNPMTNFPAIKISVYFIHETTRPGACRNYHKSSDCFEHPQKSLLKSSYPKKLLAKIFLPPKKPFYHPCHFTFGVPPWCWRLPLY